MELTVQDIINRIEPGQAAQTITPLLGGKSKSDLYLVTSSSGRTYVARFFSHENKEGRQRIIKLHMIASQQGYGPLVSYTSVSDAIILMNYLEPDLQNEQHTPEKLASLLRSIHQGPQFPSSWTIWYRTEQNLRRIDLRRQMLFSISKIREVLKKLRSQLSKDSITVPCHRDLNPRNVIVSGGRYWAIDYDDASNDDPILDLAMTGLLHAYTQQENEQLLQAYLGHSVTPQELKKFNRCRRIAIIFKVSEYLGILPEEQWNTSLDTMNMISFDTLLSGIRSGTFSIDDPKIQLQICLSGIQESIRNERS